MVSQTFRIAFHSGLFQFTKRYAHTGFIGLGAMGSQMARQLVNKGEDMIVYDLNPDATKLFSDTKIATSPQEVASQCSTVFTMVPTCSHVKSLYLGEKGIIAAAKKGTILADCSTIHPNTARLVASVASEANIDFLDAPVAGAVPAAQRGTLTFMIGGKPSVIDKIRSIILKMGTNIFHCGDIGSGLIAKICNNMMLAINALGTSETMRLASENGMDLHQMTKILNLSSGRNWVSETYHPVPNIIENAPSSKDYAPGFKVELITKDLGLACSLAAEKYTEIPLGSTSFDWFKLARKSGYAEKDFTVIYQLLNKKA